MEAVICPVCKGKGQVCVGIDVSSSSAVPMLKPCHGCESKGWVVIPSIVMKIPKSVAEPFFKK